MKPMLAATFAILFLAERVRAADDVKFYPPEGWTVTKQLSGTATLEPPGVPAGKSCRVIIWPDVDGDLTRQFDAGWKRMSDLGTVISGGNPVDAKSAGDFATRSTTAVVDVPGVGQVHMHFFAVQAGPRVRTVGFASDNHTQFDKHLPAVKAMLDGVGIDPAVVAKQKEQRAAALANGPAFEGVFYRYKVGFDAAGGRGDVAERVDYLCFATDGRAYDGHPTGGPIACFEHDDPRSPSYGRYTLSGDEIVIKWNHDPILNQRHTEKLRLLPNGKLEKGGETFHKFAGCDGLKLDGAYSIRWGDGSTTVIRFTKDGRFTERGLNTCVNLDDFVHPEWPDLPESGSGSYTIRRNTLEVKYDNDGPTRRMFFTTPDEPTNPKRIAIANNPLERE